MTIELIRKQVLTKRKALSFEKKNTLDQELFERFLRSKFSKKFDWNHKKTALYQPILNEPDLKPFALWLKQQGAELYYPRIIEKNDPACEMEMAEAPALETQWHQGKFGIQQPDFALPSVEPGKLDVVFVPGVAFGRQGERIGMGAGFYDRYLIKAPQAHRFALAFDFQLFDQLEQNPWDQKMHSILTEREEIWGEQG